MQLREVVLTLVHTLLLFMKPLIILMLLVSLFLIPWIFLVIPYAFSANLQNNNDILRATAFTAKPCHPRKSIFCLQLLITHPTVAPATEHIRQTLAASVVYLNRRYREHNNKQKCMQACGLIIRLQITIQIQQHSRRRVEAVP